nr:hypothetical protein Itr_chr15CG10530 [Ipomoea trifida]
MSQSGPHEGLATFHSGMHFQYKVGNKYRAQFYRLAQHAGPVTSSKRMAYPTFSPRSVSISSLTLFATLIAATRLGWFLQQPPQSDFREPPTQKLMQQLEKPQRDTSDIREVLAEEESRLDFPPYREPEDLTEEPDARIGVGDGATLSQGEAAPRHNTLPERGVWPPNHGETSRTSGEAPINIGDGEEPEKVAIDAVEPEKFAGCEGLVVVVESGLPAVTGLVVVGVRSAVVGVCLNRQKQNGGKGN